MSLHRGTGLIPDDEPVVRQRNDDWPLSGLVGAGRRPLSVSYSGALDRIIDQEQTNSCVGCAFSTAMFLRGQLSTPIRRPSPKVIYDLGRLIDENELFDIGCRPQDAIVMVGKHGIVAEEDWPLFTSDKSLLALSPPGKEWIDTPPDFTVLHQAADAVVTGCFGADGGDIVATLEQALHVRQIPMFAMYVADDYQDVRGTEVYDHPGRVDSTSSHMQAMCGYDEDSFHIVSSWGEGHGNRGIVRIAKSFIASSNCFARKVITQVPTLRR